VFPRPASPCSPRATFAGNTAGAFALALLVGAGDRGLAADHLAAEVLEVLAALDVREQLVV
jgi:hypothetical protein